MVRRRSNRRRNLRFRRNRKSGTFLKGGNVQASPIPRARALAPWNPLNVIRYIATEPATDAKITFSYLFDIIVSQYGISPEYIYVRLHSIELRDMNARSMSMFVFSTVDDITADACPISSQKSSPAPMANARVKFVYPLTNRQVPLYLKKGNTTNYLATYRVGSAQNASLTGKNVMMIITGSWISGAAAFSHSLPGSEHSPDELNLNSCASICVHDSSMSVNDSLQNLQM